MICSYIFYLSQLLNFALEIQYAAAHYYKKALEYPPMVTDAEVSIGRWICLLYISWNMNSDKTRQSGCIDE